MHIYAWSSASCFERKDSPVRYSSYQQSENVYDFCIPLYQRNRFWSRVRVSRIRDKTPRTMNKIGRVGGGGRWVVAVMYSSLWMRLLRLSYWLRCAARALI